MLKVLPGKGLWSLRFGNYTESEKEAYVTVWLCRAIDVHGNDNYWYVSIAFTLLKVTPTVATDKFSFKKSLCLEQQQRSFFNDFLNSGILNQ